MLRPVASTEDTVQLFLAALDARGGAGGGGDALIGSGLPDGAGDEPLNRLLERLRPRLVLWCASRMSPKLKQKVEPDDMAQDVMVRVNGSIGTFEGRDYPAFRGWLFTLAANAIRDAVKHHDAKKRQRPDPRSFSQTSPSERASRTEELARMRDAIGQLRPDDQEVIRLRCFEELAHAEVAERMGRTETAVRILYCRALKNLRNVVDDLEAAGPVTEPA